MANITTYIMPYKLTPLRRYGLLIILLVVIFSLRLYQAINFNHELEAPSQVLGLVNTQPQYNGWQYSFTVREVEVIIKQQPAIALGDTVSVIGKAEFSEGEGGIKTVQISNARIEVIKKFETQPLSFYLKHPVLSLQRMLTDLKEQCVKQLRAFLSPDETGVVTGMLLGEKSLMSYSLKNELQSSGLIHLVVASGSNIALLTAFIQGLTHGLFTRKRRIWLTLSIVGLYLLLAGLQPPLIRATVMIGLSSVASYMGRKASTIWVLGLTILILLITDPLLLFSASFQLSVAATAGIVLFGQMFQNKGDSLIAFLPWGKDTASMVVGALSQTLAAQVFIIPLLFHLFGKTNLLGIIPNVLVAVLITPIIFMGLVLLLFSYTLPLVAVWISWVQSLLIQVFFAIAHVFGSHLVLNAQWELPWVGVFVMWGVTLGWYWWENKINQKPTL